MNTQQEADYVVFIGRMQPPHMAHIEIIYRALQQGKKVIILIGSANQPRTITNPWTWKERADMIRACFPPEDQSRLLFQGMSDAVSNTVWATDVQETVADVIKKDRRKDVKTNQKDFLDVNFNPVIKLIGHKKDESSFYLDMFPQWKDIIVDNIDDLNSTDIRLQMFESQTIDTDSKMFGIPKSIADYLKAFMNSEHFENLQNEYDFNKQYKRAWDWNGTLDNFLESTAKMLPEGASVEEVIKALRQNHTVAPYDPIFNTVDAVVVQSGHVLLIRRRSAPGKGTWALPGGFLNPDERIEDAVVRELREETKIKVIEPILRSKVENNKNMKVFDKPDRSLRGRTVTFAHYIELPPGPLPKVKGSDDADKAKWVPLSVFNKMEDQLFEDHFRIVQHFVDSSED